jgi:hypothetical protein
MWSWIAKAANDTVKFFDGKKRRIAVIGGAATSIGALTGYLPLVIVGTALTAIFGTADQVQKMKKHT